MNDYEYSMPEEFTYDPADTEEDRDRKHAAFSEWSAEQATKSRQHAMAHAQRDLDQPLRRFLDDDELDRMIELTIDMQRTLVREGFEAGQVYVMATLRVTLEGERTGRAEMTEEARIALEANGHEAFVVRERNGEAWFVVCSCDYDSGDLPTRDDAIADGKAHFEEHGGGRWRTHLSD